MVDTYKNYAKNNPNSTTHAIQRNLLSGGLSSMFQACNSDGFWERFNQKIASPLLITQKEILGIERQYPIKLLNWSDTQRSSYALQSLLNEDPNALSYLTNGDIAKLVEITNSPDYSDNDLLEKLKNKYSPVNDLQFNAYALPKYRELLNTLNNDPLIRNAEKNWKDYSETDRLEVGRRVGEIQSSIFGYKPYQVEFTDEDVSGHADAKDKFVRFGKQKTMDESTTFSEFMDTAIHENDHVFQHSISDKISLIMEEEKKWLSQNKKEQNMSPEEFQSFNAHMQNWVDKNIDGGLSNKMNAELLYGGSLRSSAIMIHASEDFYIDPDEDLDAYFNNPSEKHSWHFSGIAKEYFEAPEEERPLLSGLLNDAIDDINLSVIKNKSDTEKYSPETTCNTISAPQIEGVKWK